MHLTMSSPVRPARTGQRLSATAIAVAVLVALIALPAVFGVAAHTTGKTQDWRGNSASLATLR
ncbi:hypothetical protein FDP22_13040 [Paroceanicella profunda]|uniref:Uncharacterized protein n=1 Tax=Paroceanicella profunda TaxID=2579971 RepID=A0A5B8FYZ2_9RHOB|nr:hypothetical protein [Paroceanicella profunda]QDL92630.1 hypothetical protein FDP22_13040 [Paroceanicella profunda]